VQHEDIIMTDVRETNCKARSRKTPVQDGVKLRAVLLKVLHLRGFIPLSEWVILNTTFFNFQDVTAVFFTQHFSPKRRYSAISVPGITRIQHISTLKIEPVF
jgi:hypothetical protein